jgi:hypothetical protein
MIERDISEMVKVFQEVSYFTHDTVLLAWPTVCWI